MAITRLNHAVLYVRDAERSAAFYQEVLGFRRLAFSMPGAVFLQASGSTNDHDLALFSIGDGDDAAVGRRSVGLYHLAWEVETLTDLEGLQTVLGQRGALVGASDHGTTKSVYGRDPDGLEFELVWIIPAPLLDDGAREAAGSVRPLDLAREQARYGADTAGGR